MIKLEICGMVKVGFWAWGVFVVSKENSFYYIDNEGVWRVVDATK